jgi:hypothetical protein
MNHLQPNPDSNPEENSSLDYYFTDFVPMTNGGYTENFNPEAYKVTHLGKSFDGLEIFSAIASMGTVCIFKGKFKGKTYVH